MDVGNGRCVDNFHVIRFIAKLLVLTETFIKAAMSLVRRAADELRGPGTFEIFRDVYTQGDMH